MRAEIQQSALLARYIASRLGRPVAEIIALGVFAALVVAVAGGVA